MTLPNFLIVGAPKSGTTSLYRYLQAHPDVFLPEVKEPGFFAPNEGRKVETRREYEKLFAGVREKAIGEASVTYLYDRDAALLIRETLGPDVKIVILLRNPVDKSRSQWRYEHALGREDLAFAEALAAEPGRLAGTIPVPPGGQAATHYAYVSRSRYAPQVKRYLDTFGPARMHVRIFEEFFADPGPAYADVCSFLGIRTDHVPDFRVHNRSGEVRIRALAELVNRRARWKEAVKALLPLGVRFRLLDWTNRWNTRSRPLPAVTVEERAALQLLFEEDVRALERLLERDLSKVWW